jgi:hypothetical protein
MMVFLVKLSRITSRAMIFLFIMALLVVQPVSNSYAQADQGWTEPVLMGPGWFPAITTDLTGAVHLTWSSAIMERDPNVPSLRPSHRRGYDLVLYRHSEDGMNWSETQDIVAFRQSEGSEVTRPSMLIDPDGTFHMTFRYNRVFYSNSRIEDAGSAKSWSRYYPLSVDQVAYFSWLERDSQGRLHVVFTENVRTFDCPICYHLFYRYSNDNGANWSIRTDVSSLPIGVAKPQLIIDADDNLHVVWEAGRGGALGQLSDPTTVMYAASYDGGNSWNRPLEFVVPDGRAKNITIGVDGLGQLVVVWLALPENTVYYQVSKDQGRTWSNAEPMTSIRGGFAVYNARLDHYTMAKDGGGNLHLVLVGRVTNEARTLQLLHLSWNGSKWSEPGVITTLVGDAPEWPRVAVANGNVLHVTWFVRDEDHIFDSDRGDYHVWYANKTINAPYIEPQVFPTPTPTPAIIPTPTLTIPTPTPVDPSIAEDPIKPEQALSVYGELDEMLVMGRALIPAALIILLVVAFIRMRKQ